MKVRVKIEFKDKYTGELHKRGEEQEMAIDRINEVLKVGNFIELIEQSELMHKTTEPTEPAEQSPDDEESQEESADTGEQAEEPPKQTTRRKRSK